MEELTVGFLAEILRANGEAVRDLHYGDGLPPHGPTRRPSLRAAVKEHHAKGALLAEYKRISPGQTTAALPARTVADFVREIESAPIAGYSCLATVPRFEGAPRDVLDLVRATPRPVLFKDFVVDDRQLDAAERSGASAVLLIARLAHEGYLDRPLAELAQAAHRRGLEVLLEFHAKAELSEAEDVAADMFGVNVRNLDTLRIDRRTATETLRMAGQAGLRPLIGLSGVESAADALAFWSAGADGILVGSAVARSDRPGDFLTSLLRPAATEGA